MTSEIDEEINELSKWVRQKCRVSQRLSKKFQRNSNQFDSEEMY